MNKKFLELKNITGLNQSEFSQLINDLFKDIKTIKISYQDALQIWNNIYTEIFDRTGIYNNDDIVNLHVQFKELIQENKEALKNYSDVLTFENTDKLYSYLIDTYMNKDENINKLQFKMSHTSLYKCTSSKMIEDVGRGSLTWELIFNTEFSGDYEYRIPSIRIIIKDRYIKSTDKMILKSIESIELY